MAFPPQRKPHCVVVRERLLRTVRAALVDGYRGSRPEAPAVVYVPHADLASIAQFNRTETPFPDDVTLPQLIDAQLGAHSARTAVICDHDPTLGVPSLTYAQLNEFDWSGS